MWIEQPGILVLALIVIAVTHWLGGITAYGSTLLAFPALIWLVDLQVARTVLLVIGAIQAYQVFIYTWRDANWGEFGRMTALAGIGLPVGVLAVHYLPEAPLLIGLGLVLTGSGLSKLLRRGEKAEQPWPALILNGLLLLGGIIHGAFVSGGATLVVYAQHKIPTKDAFRGTLSSFWVVINTILIGMLFFSKRPGGLTLPLLLAGIPLTILINWLANCTARRMSQKQFMKLVAGLLVLAGGITIARVIFKQ